MSDRQVLALSAAAAFIAALTVGLASAPLVSGPSSCTIVGYGPGGIPIKSRGCSFPEMALDLGAVLVPGLSVFLVVMRLGVLALLWRRRGRSRDNHQR